MRSAVGLSTGPLGPAAHARGASRPPPGGGVLARQHPAPEARAASGDGRARRGRSRRRDRTNPTGQRRAARPSGLIPSPPATANVTRPNALLRPRPLISRPKRAVRSIWRVMPGATLTPMIKAPITPHPNPPPQGGRELDPIAPLLRDATLTEIMINGPDAIFVEREGRILLTDRRFEDENHLLNAIGALMTSAGRRLDLVDPVLEARLPDGSRLTIVLPPVAVDGPMITIRKFATSPYAIDDLIRFPSLSLDAPPFPPS